MKTESITEYLARGGKIVVIPESGSRAKKTYNTSKDKKEEDSEVDMSLVPEALKISLGMK